MKLIRLFASRAKNMFRLNRPERLWMHSCFALLTILCLLAATQYINRTIVERQAITAAGIRISQSQIMHAHEVILLAEQYIVSDQVDFAPMNKAIGQFEKDYTLSTSSELRSPEQWLHYFNTANSIDTLVRDFIDTAIALEDAPKNLHASLVEQLNDIYDNQGLRDGLTQAATLLEKQAHAEAQRLSWWERTMLIVSAATLLAEAVFVFFPTHMAVQTTIRQLQQQAQKLRESRTQLRVMNRELAQQARRDPLTGLPNRASLTAYLENLCGRKKIRTLSVLFIGIDNFKSINDSAGHDFGDALLVAVANTLDSCIDEDHIAARVGGDEYVIVSDEPSEELISRVRASISEPFDIKGRRVPINISIGFLEFETNTSDPMAVIANAAIALQIAKNGGENSTQQFTQSLRDDVENLRMLQLELSDAIKKGEIEPWFQPQIRLSDGCLHGVEVLARWRHPTRGLLTPDRFIPAAERAGLIIEMDHTIWRSAMAHADLWQKESLWHPCISLNAAPDTISDPYLIERFLLELQRSGLGVDQVNIEVLETTLINGADDMAAINIDSLAECGIGLELDDFGTGYASLSKLTQLPLDGIKLDRSLVAPLPDSAADSVVRAILALASELGLTVVAEGIEEDAQAKHLNDRGCAIGQGYGYAKPMPPSEFRAWLEIHAKSPLQIAAPATQFVQ
ncbi:putative bifunctional diguanylate cyclase/phosphodiesterase [Loktanella sp. S4079]|uniref:putative bifunctional diguanylate cyclase/phosphodiesterase n=1 Tax=Loktanella sp. S4079 TaxID=579483 RepID=UPI0005FA7BA1|nr:bifunctional diguanylate cyclase/phosphodiesterase [Loktanella sp. S4079]